MNILQSSPTETNELKEIYSNFKFPLDDFQKNAIVSINNNHNTLVTAATGSGKSLVAEYAIEKGVKSGKKVIYTSPIKSLSNQKFYEFKNKFKDMSVGILTGDIKFNPTADCIIMTTEILRNLLYNKNIKIANLEVEIGVYNEVESVIFDEVHYINDRDRGTVWEECIMLLPKHVNLVMLSATIDKADKFASWIHQIKDKPIDLIPNAKRVIPLHHYYYLMLKPETEEDELFSNKLVEIQSANGAFNHTNYDVLLKLYKHHKIFNQRNNKKLLNQIVEHLEVKELVPAIFFVFSRNKCEQYAKMIEKNLVTYVEQAEIKKTINYYINKLDNPQSYTRMESYNDIVKLLEKGICIHHSGLIPVFKEIIEMLFSKNLVKVLFATETFAVGVNMPTKTVLFTDLKKYDGYNEDFRNLQTHEYLQMSGRAGRRGLDTKGIVIHLPNLNEMPNKSEMNQMMTGRTQTITSKFGLNYQFMLKMILTSQDNFMDFVGTSLMNRDISERMFHIKDELDGINVVAPDNATQMEEYYYIVNPRPYHKMTNKQIKRNRVVKQQISKLATFAKDYDNYLKYRKQIENRDELNNQFHYYQNIVNTDIKKIIDFLQAHDYMSSGTISPENVSLKGVIASQINECNSILFTELLTSTILDNVSVPELAALLSIFTDIDSKDEFETPNNLGYELNDKIRQIKIIADKLDNDEYDAKLDINSEWKLSLKSMEMTYAWAQGTDLKDINLDVYEGNFIKIMIKINNIATNVEKMSELLGKHDLARKANELQSAVMRDIVNIESLYIMNSLSF